MAVRRLKTREINNNANYRTPYKFRQIITTGFVAGGYKSGVPWRNVNSMDTSTDITTSRGDLLQSSGAYTAGACNWDNAWLFSTGGMGAYSYTSTFNMRNLTTKTHQSAFNTPSRVGDCAVVQEDWWFAWVFNDTRDGGVQNRFRFNLTTEVCETSTQSILNGSSLGRGSHYTDTHGFVWGTNTDIYFTYATETQVTGPDYSASGQQKGQNSKDGFGWAGHQGTYNGGYQFRRTYHSTNVVSGVISKPIGNCGEENLGFAQDHGYMLGMYDGGGQNNKAWRWQNVTETGYEGGSSMQPKGSGIGGRSSGHCFQMQ